VQRAKAALTKTQVTRTAAASVDSAVAQVELAQSGQLGLADAQAKALNTVQFVGFNSHSKSLLFKGVSSTHTYV
jgi:hypothetical protein